MKSRSASRETSRQCHTTRTLLIFPRDSFRWVFTRAKDSDRGKEKRWGRKREKKNSLYSSHDATFCRGKPAGGLETANRETGKSCGEKQREQEGKRERKRKHGNIIE